MPNTPTKPPMPEPVGFVDADGDFHGFLPANGRVYSSDQMLAYAEAIAAERVREWQADAERYRWLRDGCNEKAGEATRIAQRCYGLEWDAAIDAAIQGAPNAQR